MQGKNMDSYINHYIGEWENEAGNRLKIKKVDDRFAIQQTVIRFPETE